MDGKTWKKEYSVWGEGYKEKIVKTRHEGHGEYYMSFECREAGPTCQLRRLEIASVPIAD